jgi:hypothetical protein
MSAKRDVREMPPHPFRARLRRAVGREWHRLVDRLACESERGRCGHDGRRVGGQVRERVSSVVLMVRRLLGSR